MSGPIPAGTWRLIGDGIVLGDVDMRFEVIWKSAAGESAIVTFDHHFERPEGDAQFRAVAYEAETTGAAVGASEGDTLILRMTAVASPRTGPVFVPNGDGRLAEGRIPSIDLP